MTDFAIGQRIALAKDVEIYPIDIYRAGMVGTLIRKEIDCYWVKLDEYRPELAEWSNEIQIMDSCDLNGPEEHPSTYLRLLQASDPVRPIGGSAFFYPQD